MNTTTFSFTYNDTACQGSGDVFTTADLPELNKAYFGWKALNNFFVSMNCRRTNLPEALSEGLAAALFGWVRTNASAISGLKSSSCDLVDVENGKLIQLKACSTSADKQPGPTSFGPRTEFDTLIFMHLDCDNDTASFYELDADTYKDWRVNRTETIADQQAQGRRPRVTILPKIQANGIQPFKTYKFE